MDPKPKDSYTWFDEPAWLESASEGSWLRLKSLSELQEINRVVDPQWQVPVQVLALHGKKVQLGRRTSYHGDLSLVTLYGISGHFIPEFFELEKIEPDPIDYDWSGKLAKLYVNHGG